ncbi:L-threonylcarbamoyladenylate synthase [Flavobacteriales bacterium]|nr:L-threonylcarbamoyladenylate synthase [Flavobacteriales bacterium]
MQKAIEILRNGGIILYPTDTIWGIGCDATNPEAVKKIYDLKKRESSKSMIVLLEKDTKLNRYVKNIPEIAWDIVDLSEKPTTIIYPEGYNLAHNILAEDKSIAIRIVKEGFCHDLIRKFGKPLVSTSANISNSKSPLSFSDIDKRILEGVDYIVNLPADVKLKTKSSTIMKIDLDSTFTLIRK